MAAVARTANPDKRLIGIGNPELVHAPRLVLRSLSALGGEAQRAPIRSSTRAFDARVFSPAEPKFRTFALLRPADL